MLLILQIVVAIILGGLIILQQEGSGLGSAFGSSASFRTRQGIDKVLFRLTVILLIVFLVLAIVSVLK